MFSTGQIVTLAVDKTHGDNPEHAMSIHSGICGMIMNRERQEGGNHLYVIDFGPEGQWHCYHEELRGDDSEGWEADDVAEETTPERPVDPDDDHMSFTYDSVETSNEETKQPKSLAIDRIDPEADMKRREKELKRGIKIK